VEAVNSVLSSRISSKRGLRCFVQTLNLSQHILWQIRIGLERSDERNKDMNRV